MRITGSIHGFLKLGTARNVISPPDPYSDSGNCSTRRSAAGGKSILLSSLVTLVAMVAFGQGDVNRTLIDNEYGQYYGYAPNPSAAGVEVLPRSSEFFASMAAEAIKAPHGHLQHFAPADPSDDFPYNELKAFETAEVAAGRPPIFVTATYAGKKRPVYFAWHLALDNNNRPTAPSSQWSQAVNLHDDRFIKFYTNIYLHKTLWQPLYQTYWQAADNGAFRYDNYGVLDDNGVFVDAVTWDPPFAQNDSDFLNTIIYFLSHIAQVAPDVQIMINEGSMAQENLFSSVFAGFAGTIREEINYYSYPQAYYRGQVYLFFQRFQYEGPAGKAALLRSLLPSQSDSTFTDRLRTGLMTYLIFRGPNFFWGPRFDDGTVAGVPASLYATMHDSLGLPTATAQTQSATNDGYRLYWRNCEGGIAYLNWTGLTQTINLDRTYYDRNGNAVKSITIPDLTGDYVLFQPGPRAQRPTINPRRSAPVSGPLAVTLATDSAQTIRYTLDGSDPTSSSSLYSAPINLTQSATVKAKAFCSNCAASFTSQATYSIQSTPPAVAFYTTADSGTPYLSANYPLVVLTNPSGMPATVAYALAGGTAQNGVDYVLANRTLTFNPGEIQQSFPITIINHSQTSDKTIIVNLTSPGGAVLGANVTFTYTILGLAGSSPNPPVRSAGSPSGTLPSTTTSATLSLVTDLAATCRYSTTAGVSYSAMTNVFAVTGGTSHSTPLTNLHAGTTYKYYVRCQSSVGIVNTNDYAITFSTLPATAGLILRINSGGTAYVDSAGNNWVADTNYWGGSSFTTSVPITGTTTPVLYQTARVGANGYDFAVPNGSYTVHLKFAELEYLSVGDRIFDISLNDQTVLSNFDILAAAGGKNRAVDLTFTTTVTYGELAIILTSEKGPTAIGAIEIIQN